MKIKKDEIIFSIRAYNEASRIGSTIESILAAGYTHILVVDDGSKDATQQVLAKFPGLHIVRHPFNRGGGAAAETGLDYIRRKGEKLGIRYAVTFDADGQMDVVDMAGFIAAFEKTPELDIVFGSRFIKKTKSNVPFIRRIILMGGKIFTYMISGVLLTDSHNGYRMIRLEAVKKIRLTMDGMEYASELIEEVHQKGLRFAEVPVNIHYTEYSLGKGQKSINAINIAFKMIWKKFFN